MGTISGDHALTRKQIGLAIPGMENESQSPDAVPSAKNRKPWPMWPIAVSILAFIVFYTWVQFKFRKVERPFEPSWAMKERENRVAQKNLYDWYSLSVTSTSDAPGNGQIPISPGEHSGTLENELPSQIVYYLPRRPILVPTLSSVSSNELVSSGDSLSLAIEMPRDFAESPSLHLTALYKEGTLILLAEMRVENDKELDSLDTRSPGKTLYYSIDTTPIQSEEVRAKLYSEEQVFDWIVEFDQ